jgi:predicted nuclease of predicted toxin-antitoxin system
MTLRFFADHCVSNSVIETLRDAGYEILRLKDHIPTDSSDSVVISMAQELDATLISLNGDFADIVTYPPEKYKGIIALQVRNHPEVIPQIMSKLIDFLSSNSDEEYYAGKLLLVESHRIRVRG